MLNDLLGSKSTIMKKLILDRVQIHIKDSYVWMDNASPG